MWRSHVSEYGTYIRLANREHRAKCNLPSHWRMLRTVHRLGGAVTDNKKGSAHAERAGRRAARGDGARRASPGRGATPAQRLWGMGLRRRRAAGGSPMSESLLPLLSPLHLPQIAA